MSLHEWILSHLSVDNPVGDLARELSVDRCAVDAQGRPLGTYQELLGHLLNVHAACPGATFALRDASHARGQRARKGAWWVACSECPPHVNGDAHYHFVSAKNRVAREHVRRSRHPNV